MAQITKVALLGSIDFGDRLIVPEPAAESPAFEIAMKGRTEDGYKDDRFVLFKALSGPAILAKLPGDAGDFDDPDQEAYYRELQGARLVITTEKKLAALHGAVIGVRDKFKLG